MQHLFKGFPWYVLLFLLYPPLNLLGQNIGEVDYSAANRAIAILLIFGISTVFLIQWILKDWKKTGVLFTLLSILFFSYGHVLNYIASLETAMSVLGRHRYMAPTWTFFALLSVIGILRVKSDLVNVASALKTVSVVLVLFPIFQLSVFVYKDLSQLRADDVQMSNTRETVMVDVDPSLPDIYYIILDAYGRSDILKREIKFDNSNFIAQLEQLGFYVATCSQSNYGQTAISLSSSLNMNYLDALGDEFVPGNKDRYYPLWNLIETNEVMKDLRQKGYKIVAFETGYQWTEFRNANYYFAPPQRGMTGFESLLLRNSAALFLDYYGIFDQFRLTSEVQKRNLILYVLDKLTEVPQLPGPKFVFVHLVIPHQPFVLGPNGEELVVAPRTLNQDSRYEREDYLQGYLNQVVYISKRFPEIMEKIINNSSSLPVIVIQGDHGPGHLSEQTRMAILNSYYLPNSYDKLYPTITPVNTFRTIFNSYLGGSFDILPDKSYYSIYNAPYKFQEIDNNCVIN